jgi:hypothetical protein
LATEAPKVKVEYSADSSMEMEQGSMKGRVYSAPGKERREMDQNGQKIITIMRLDKKMVWMLMPEQKMYMENPMDDSKPQPGNMSGYKVEQTVVGPETVNGVKATKGKVVMTDSKGTKMGGFMWTTSDGIVVKTDVLAMDNDKKMRIKMDLTNLKVGHQDPALFEIPAGYTSMSMGGMFGGMMGGRHK